MAKDLAKDKLSSKNQKSRHSFIQQLDGLIQKIQRASSVGGPVSEPSPPPITQHRPPPQLKPPPAPPIEDEGGEMYEVPDKPVDVPQPSEYTSFLPVSLDEPQVSLLYSLVKDFVIFLFVF